MALAFTTPASALDPAFEALLAGPATTIDQRCRNAFLRLELDVLDRGASAFRSPEDIQADVDAPGKLVEGGCNPRYLSELRFCLPFEAYRAEGNRRWRASKLAARIADCLQDFERRGLRAGR